MSKVSGTEDTEVHDKDYWNIVVKPTSGFIGLQLNEVWHYRDLFWLLVRRDFMVLVAAAFYDCDLFVHIRFTRWNIYRWHSEATFLLGRDYLLAVFR
jgi:hypothetical protein